MNGVDMSSMVLYDTKAVGRIWHVVNVVCLFSLIEKQKGQEKEAELLHIKV